jgi:cell division protein FtsB
MARTLEQKIAALDARIARLRHQNRKLETGQKIILGGMLPNAARKDARIRGWLIKEAAQSILRDVDKRRLAPIIDELNSLNIKI